VNARYPCGMTDVDHFVDANKMVDFEPGSTSEKNGYLKNLQGLD
jgi:hypothetical protein